MSLLTSLIEPLSLVFLAVGVATVFRFVWADSQRFRDVNGLAEPNLVVTPATTRRLAMEVEAARAAAEIDSLPRAA